MAQQQEEDRLLAVGKHCTADTAATVHHTGGPVHHTAEAERIVEGGTAAGVEDMAVDPGTVNSLVEVGPGRAAEVGSRGLGAGNWGEEAEVNTHRTAGGETPHETYVHVVAGCTEAALYLTCNPASCMGWTVVMVYGTRCVRKYAAELGYMQLPAQCMACSLQ